MSGEYRKKLIEVALPLQAINLESAREKSIRHGHPSTLHLWWARRPLATCRAVLFASLVDDPSARPEEFPTEEAQERERQRLFRIIEQLVKWDNSTNETVLSAARAEILRSTNGNPPPVLDPFCGGGSIPLEAQRLGLEAHGSDLNPVAVLITKSLIEIPPKFAGMTPVNPDGRAKGAGVAWRGATGLADDVRYYGQWMRDEAYKRIGHLYPKVRLPRDHGGGEATVIAWLWARTVKCPNPACGAQMPLARSFALSTKKGREAWVEPVVDRSTTPYSIRFKVKVGGDALEGTVNRRGAVCLASRTPVPFDYVRAEGRAGRIGQQLMAVVAHGQSGRTYLSPSDEHAPVATVEPPEDVPDTNLPEQALGFRVQLYGMTKHRDLFTSRQLVALTTLSDLVTEVREMVLEDARAAGRTDDLRGIDEGGMGAQAYADSVSTYLALSLDKMAARNNALSTWESGMGRLASAFGMQTISMKWDFAETNPFAGAGGDFLGSAHSLAEVLDSLRPGSSGTARQTDATQAIDYVRHPLVSTDPPYYDNIGYADLSDFFYVWLRRSLQSVYPGLFGTIATPKSQELIAGAHRFGGDRRQAQSFFETGLGTAFEQIRQGGHAEYPLAVYYAFRQAESEGQVGNGSAIPISPVSTGWETMLEGLLRAGFQITGTWPVRTEQPKRMRDKDANALTSSIVLVCRARPGNARLQNQHTGKDRRGRGRSQAVNCEPR